jgi:DNA-binding transcriptional LysR family regulator
MKLSDLELFLDIARAGSFAKVADQRGVDPSSISRHIAGLESKLGFRLFERTTRRLALTEAGLMVRSRIPAPLEEIRQVFSEAADVLNIPKGLLRVTASVAFGERWLAPRILEFQDRFPEIRLDLVLTDRNMDLVAENVDIAIRLGEQMEGSYVVSLLMKTRYRIVASPKYLDRYGSPANPSELEHHNCLCFSLPQYGMVWRFRDAAQEQSEVSVGGTATMTNALAIRRAALEGIGIALLGDWMVDEDIEEGMLVNLFPDMAASATGFDTAAWVLYPSKDYVPAKTRAFVDFVKAGV